MNVKVGDLFVWEDIKMYLVEIKDIDFYKMHVWETTREYDWTYSFIQIKAILGSSYSLWKYYPVVK